MKKVTVSNGHWSKLENVKKKMIEIAILERYIAIDDWYECNFKTLKKNNAVGLLDRYKTLHAILHMVFPDYHWLPWCFANSPKNFWMHAQKKTPNFENIKMYIEWLRLKLKFHSNQDMFNNISMKQFKDNCGGGLMNHKELPWTGSIYKLFKSVFPDEVFDPKKRQTAYSHASIAWIECYAAKYYPGARVQHAMNGGEAKLHPSIGKVDGYIKEHQVVMEFLGKYYHGDPRLYNPHDLFPLNKNLTYGDLCRSTIIKKNKIIALGYKYVCVWESDWLNHVDESDLSLSEELLKLSQVTDTITDMVQTNITVIKKYYDKTGMLPVVT